MLFLILDQQQPLINSFIYDLNNKINVLIDDGWFNWFGPGLMLLIGFILLIVGYSEIKKSGTY